MSRDTAIAAARETLASGAFARRLADWVARPTASRLPGAREGLAAFAESDLAPVFHALGFQTRLLDHPDAPGPCLYAERIEGAGLPTFLQYGHGDVVAGLDGWSEGLSPFEMTERDGLWFGRGTADNKGQLCVNLTALEALIATRGRLGFNVKYLVEMGEESGSPGLREICRENAALLAADLLIASDGPRLALDRPTLFLGARGGVSFYIEIVARDGFQHSGNWGGLLSNPGVELCHAITALIGRHGEIRVRELVPAAIPENVRRHLSRVTITPTADDPPIDRDWGEPGLTPEEKVFAFSSLEVMEMECGNLAQPLYAIPPRARARLQLRFPVGVDVAQVVPAVRRALTEAGFGHVTVHEPHDAIFLPTRLDPDHPWVGFVAGSIERTAGAAPAILPGIGGSLPNDIFATDLGLPTIWIPHSYPSCRQHAADEHLPVALAREAQGLMAGLYWDLGEAAASRLAADLTSKHDQGQP
ncbi:M20/M25/M40 family metallo-hydrolase [Paracoccus sp. S-4012]|uniref:M20/M25/M40 family metallo-hydrolase n=1 Tax=Paracoccus sp. S-4012 TaxID=2665648 RepID=UPI0012B13438|nr:M20/M25/M40 family metallo-hydrolase [Paracoccus sp. S-4012]MRX50105.1 M20/M25/M40 family metallo-hydrolase [Paracoccus sp. S-4012]